MKIKKLYIAFYMVIALICIHGCTSGIVFEDVPSEYNKAMEKLEYQLGYSSIYCNKVTYEDLAVADTDLTEPQKTVYLTFDDGPSMRTEEILDLLQEYNIKATFFIVNNEAEKAKELVKRTFEEGHTVGVHSATHSYNDIYKSVDSFLDDFELCYNYIYDITGEYPSIYRFPGGSVNNYNNNICKDIVAEMNRRGFTYFDWNISSDDATKSYSADSIYQKVMNGCETRNNCVVLMHDSSGKKATVSALKRLIPDLLAKGYVFDKLDETVQPTVFRLD